MGDWYTELVASSAALRTWPLEICQMVATNTGRQFEPWYVCEVYYLFDARAVYAGTTQSKCIAHRGTHVTRIWENADNPLTEWVPAVVPVLSETDSVFHIDTDSNGIRSLTGTHGHRSYY